MKPRLIQQILGAIARSSGRRYAIDLDALDEPSLRELIRLLRDLDQEQMIKVRRARTSPWRHP
jgi:hypothetical protein